MLKYSVPKRRISIGLKRINNNLCILYQKLSFGGWIEDKDLKNYVNVKIAFYFANTHFKFFKNCIIYSLDIRDIQFSQHKRSRNLLQNVVHRLNHLSVLSYRLKSRKIEKSAFEAVYVEIISLTYYSILYFFSSERWSIVYMKINNIFIHGLVLFKELDYNK